MPDLAHLLDQIALGKTERVIPALSSADDLDRRGPSGHTLLTMAARRGDLPLVSALLEAGADPNRSNERGTSPLMFAKTAAFASGDLRVLERLLEAGADPEQTDQHGKTALDYTRERANLVIGFLSAARP